MKKINAILMLFVSVLLISCGKFADGTSVWAGGVWILPVGLFCASVYFLFIAYTKSKSGSEQQTKTGYSYSDENVPIYKIGQFYFAVAFFVAAIVVIILQNSEK